MDIIIPVYGAASVLRDCLASVAVHTDLARHRVLLVIDGPQDAEVESLLGGFALLRNAERLGFAAAVNRGMSATTSDVVLLNSDTVVTPRWLEKMIDAAYSSGDVGTVTPLSNHATLCSVPRAFEENLLPTGFDATSFAALIETVSAREYPRLPTAVGVCMYIRRALLDEIGLFDAARFTAGYGEENDFCMRALARGWLHVADDATFIYHAGGRSFGKSRVRLQRQAARALRRAHPSYMATIAAFMREDSLAAVRGRILAGLSPPRPFAPRERGEGARSADEGPRQHRRIVHLVHGWPPFQQAGTELYAYWLVRQQRTRHDVSVYTRSADPSHADGEAVELSDDGVRVRLVTNNFTARNPLRRNALCNPLLERDFAKFLEAECPHLVHIHHLAGHAFSLVRVARRLGIPVVLQIQDWWFLCARVNLFHRDGYRCSGPGLDKCARCVTLTRLPLLNRVVHLLRRRAARAAIRACTAYIVGSKAIAADYASLVSSPIHVIPYGVGIAVPSEPRPAARPPIRFGYVGSIAPHKGVHVAVEAMRGLGATLSVWGDAAAYPDYVATMKRDNVVFEGRFREEDKPHVFASMDVLLVPSIGLESFGLAAREAMTCGVPVLASAGGALDEMFPSGTCGDFFPAGDAAALRPLLQRVIDDPSIIDRWRARLPRPKREDVHAAEVEAVYDAVLG